MSFEFSPVAVQFTADMAGLRRDMESMKQLVTKSVSEIQASTATVRVGDGIAAQLREAVSGVSGLRSSFSSLSGIAQAAGIVGAVAALKGMSEAALDGQVQIDKLRNTLTFTSGSAVGAGKEMEYVRQVSSSLGLELSGTATAYAKLSAAAKGTTLEGGNVKRIFEAVSKASVVMGLSQDESAGALLAISQMMSKGTVQAEELRGQLGERLPGAFQVAARAMGTTTAGLGKMLEQGQVLAADFLPKFADELEKSLAGGTEKASQSAQASINRMSSAWTEAKMALADTGAAKPAIALMEAMSAAMNQFSAGVREAKASGWNGIAAFFAGVGRVEALAVGADITKSVGEQIDLLQQERARVEKKQGKWADSPDNYDGMNASRATERLARIREINAQISAMQTAGGSFTVDLKKDFDAAEAAKKAVIDAYTNDSSRKTNAQKLADDLKVERQAFRNATAGISEESEGYQKALAAFNERKKDLAEKYKDKGSENTAYAQLNKTLTEKLALEQAELDNQGPLSAAQKARVDLQLMLAEVTGKLTKAERVQAQAKIDQIVADKESNEARAAAEKLRIDALKQRDDETKAITEETVKIRAHTAELGLSKEQIDLVRAARDDDQISLKEHELAELDATGTCTEYSESLRANVKALQERRAALKDQAIKQAGVDTAKDVSKEWKRGWEETDRIAREAFTSWAEDGSTAAEKIGRSLRSALLSAIYEATLKPIVMQVYTSAAGVLGMTGTGASGSGQFSLGNLSGLSSAFSAFPSASTALGNLSSSYYTFTTMMGNGSSFLDSAQSALAGTGSSFAALAPYASALISASQGNWGSAAGTAIGAAFGGPVGATIGGALGGLLDGGGEDPHDNADSTGLAFKLAKSGVSGTGTGAGITDEVPAYLPYSWVAGQTSGRGRWNDGTALTSAQITQIAQASAAVFASGKNMASILGVDASVVDTASVSSTGFKSVEDALGQLGDEIALKLVPNLKQFQISGQSLWQTLQTNVSAVAALKAQFQSFRDGLNMSDLSTLDPLGKYRLAKDLYNKALAAGDAAAVTSTAQSFLSASRTAFGSTGAYATDYQGVLDTLTQLENTVVQYPWAKGASGTSSTVPQLSTPANDAVVNNTQATVNVLQSGLSDIIAALQAQGETLTEIQRKLGLQLAAA